MGGWRYWVLMAWAICLALAGCGNGAPPQPTVAGPGETPSVSFEVLRDVLLPARSGQQITTAGYYFRSDDGPLLVEGLSLAGSSPRPLPDDPAQELWLGEGAAEPPAARSNGYGAAIVHGTLEGPGAFGTGGRYRYRLVQFQLTALEPLVLPLPAVLARSLTYDGQLVRISGALLVGQSDALLVEQLSAGGVPPPGARQVKLLLPFHDDALRQQLPGSSGMVRYGPVDVEGFWRGGALLPLSIVLRRP